MNSAGQIIRNFFGRNLDRGRAPLAQGGAPEKGVGFFYEELLLFQQSVAQADEIIVGAVCEPAMNKL